MDDMDTIERDSNSDRTVRHDNASDITVREDPESNLAMNSFTGVSFHIEINTPTGIRRGHLWQPIRLTIGLISMMEYVARFPSSVIEHIICEALLLTGCAIRNFAPRFSRSGVTARMSTRMREEDLQRIEVYTRGPEGQRGKYHTLDHQIDQMAKFFPVPGDIEFWDRRSPGLSAMRAIWPNEFGHARVAARESAMYYFDDTLFSFPGEDFLSLSVSMPDILYRTNTVAGIPTSNSLPFTRLMRRAYEVSVQRRNIHRLRGEYVTYYSCIRHLALASTARRRPHGAMGPEEQREFEWARTASQTDRNRYFEVASSDQMQWLWLDWDALSRLETLYMDLSAIGDVMERMAWPFEKLLEFCNVDLGHWAGTGEIRIQGMDVLNLSLLVIKGLKSHSLYVPTRDMNGLRNGRENNSKPFDFTIEEVEDKDHLSHLGVRFINWVKVFRHSLAPGGRLVFLDEQCKPEWPGWRFLNFGDSHDDDDPDDDDAPGDDAPDREAVDSQACDDAGPSTSRARSPWLPVDRGAPVRGFFQNGRFFLPEINDDLSSSSSSGTSSYASMQAYLARMERLAQERAAAGNGSATDAVDADDADDTVDAVATDMVNDLINAAVADTAADGDDDDTVDQAEADEW